MMLPPARPEPPDGARHGAVAINMPEPQPRSPSSEYADPPPPYSDGSLSSGHGTPISHSLVGTPTKKRPPPSPPVRRGSPQGAIQGLQHIPVQFRPFVVGALLVTIFLLSSMLMLPDIRPARTAQPPIQWVSKMTTSVHVHWGKEHADEELVKQYVTAVVTSPFAKPPRNYLSICAIVRNEEHYIEEWIWYHYLLGVHHFYLYENESSDKTWQKLKLFVDLGIVSAFRWPGPKRLAQETHIAHCVNITRQDESTWVGIIDVDEFITYLPHDFTPDFILNGLWGSPLHYFLSESQSRNESVVMLFRSDFGSSGQAMRPNDLLSIEAYTRRKLTVYKEQQNQAGKGLFMLQGTMRVANPHRIEHHEGYRAVDAQHNEWNYEQRERVITEPLRLNHYLTRSYSECLQKANDPRLSNMTFSWRKDQGPKLCDTFMEGTELYRPSEHLEDRFLADSMFPKVIHGIMQHYGQRARPDAARRVTVESSSSSDTSLKRPMYAA